MPITVEATYENGVAQAQTHYNLIVAANTSGAASMPEVSPEIVDAYARQLKALLEASRPSRMLLMN